jgi:uncharacterized protein YndB with AHSA1/START domain
MTKPVYTIDKGKQEMFLTRTFDVPRELVFKTINDPELIPQWWGPRYLTTRVEEMEVRPGGRWRYVQRDPEGHVHGFHGVYHDIAPPERVVSTFEYEGVPGHACLQTLTLEDLGGNKTKLVMQSVFQSVADRDGMVESGMESGATEMMDRLEELLAAARVQTR